MNVDVDELQKQTHLIYEGDVDYPSNQADEDYQIRIGYFNLAIREWEHVPNVSWKELTEWLSDVSSGERQIIAGQTRYACPDNFNKMYEGIIHIDQQKVTEIPIEKRQQAVEENRTCFYISGNPSDGYFVNFLNVDTAALVGKQFNYLFIKQAKLLAIPTDVPQCRDPNYIIHRSVSELYAQDSDPKANKELTMSQQLLLQMITANAVASIAGDNTYPIE